MPAFSRRSELPWLIGGVVVLLAGWWALNRWVLQVKPVEASTAQVLGWGTDPNLSRPEQCNIFNRANRTSGAKSLAVAVVPGGNDPGAIVTRSAAGNAPDLIDVYNPEELATYIAKGIARPLNAQLKAARLDLASETWPALVENLSRPNPAYRQGVDDPLDARLWYAVPNNVDYPFIYFNRSLWQRVASERAAAGQPVPHEPWLGWTWWDYAALAKAMQRRGPDGRFLSFGGPPPDPWILAMQVGASQRGEDRAAYESNQPALSWDACVAPFAPRPDGSLEPWPNRAALATALQFTYDLQHAWRATPTASDMQQMATGGGGYGGGGNAATGIVGQFLAGNAGMISNGRWYLMHIRANVAFDWRMVRMPRWVPYEEWARWQREGQGPGRRDGAWGDREHPDRGYLVVMNTRSTFISSSARDPDAAFRFLEMLVRNHDYQQIILLEDGASASQRTTMAYVSRPDPLIPDEAVNRPSEHELGAVRGQIGRPRWPFSNSARLDSIRWGSLGAWLGAREPLEQAQATGTSLREVPELAAFAPGERLASSAQIGEDLAARLVAAMDQAGREGLALDQPPRRQWASLATLAVFGVLAAVGVVLVRGRRRGAPAPQSASRRGLFAGVAFIAPNLILFLVFTLGPALFTLGLAFFRWDPFTAPVFVGCENFNRLFADQRFWYYLFNTAVFLLGLPLSLAGSLALAVVLSQKLRGVIAYRTIFYLPTLTSGVALFLLWKVMFNKEGGLINTLILPVLQLCGVTGTDGAPLAMSGMPDWLNQAWTIAEVELWLAKPALIAMGVWAAVGGGSMILYLAALAGIPPELYEAAEMDGANRWRSFRHITWPLIAPTTFFIVVMGVIGGLQGGFEMAYLMTNGGPDDSTTTIAYFIFNKGFNEFEFGYAAAVGFVLFAVVAAVTALNWRFGTKAENY